MAKKYGVAELKRVIPELLWIRMYSKAAARKYAEIFGVDTSLSLAKGFLDSPFHLL